MKSLICCAVAAIIVILSAAAASAQNRSQYGGYCPVGTCADNGGMRAFNVKNCKASNCRGMPASATNTGSTKKLIRR